MPRKERDLFLISQQNKFKGREGLCEFLKRSCFITNQRQHCIARDSFLAVYRVFSRQHGYSVAKPINIGRFLGRLGVKATCSEGDTHGKELKSVYFGIQYGFDPNGRSSRENTPNAATPNTTITATPNTTTAATPNTTTTTTKPNAQDQTTTRAPTPSRSRTMRRIVFTGEKDFSEFLSKQYEVTGNKRHSITKPQLHEKYKLFCAARRCLAASSFNIGMYLGRIGVRTEVRIGKKTGKVCVYIGIRSITTSHTTLDCPPSPPASPSSSPASSSSSAASSAASSSSSAASSSSSAASSSSSAASSSSSAASSSSSAASSSSSAASPSAASPSSCPASSSSSAASPSAASPSSCPVAPSSCPTSPSSCPASPSPQIKQSSLTNTMQLLRCQASNLITPLEQSILDVVFNDLETSQVLQLENAFLNTIDVDQELSYHNSLKLQEDSFLDATITQLISESTRALENILFRTKPSLLDAILTDNIELSIPD
ncbi:hypothetical protein Pmani_022937 [Petrolisthes manimaculis]|uniref:RFX-type winged-helix domain-containing protein n=1 Tax=Petrolisthes manimaculis TaxID=1843537 RepID=A0AAE1PC67_9EUCA|nr:hypothetical protein Pmani_022937 [Petrolisthes manimaculis]